jgi:hypothetical protein
MKAMFVTQEVILDRSFDVARARLLELLAGDWLSEASGEAFEEGRTGVLRVGPFGATPGMSKLVRVRFLAPRSDDQVMSVPLRWEATGRAGGLFPVLDADIALLPTAERTRLVVSASYRPPLDGFGAAADQLVMRHVATATISALVRKIADKLDASGRPPGGQPPVAPATDGDRTLPGDGAPPRRTGGRRPG